MYIILGYYRILSLWDLFLICVMVLLCVLTHVNVGMSACMHACVRIERIPPSLYTLILREGFLSLEITDLARLATLVCQCVLRILMPPLSQYQVCSSMFLCLILYMCVEDTQFGSQVWSSEHFAEWATSPSPTFRFWEKWYVIKLGSDKDCGKMP